MISYNKSQEGRNIKFMRKMQRNMAVFALILLMWSGSAGCTQADVQEYLQQSRQPEQAEEHQNQKQAEDVIQQNESQDVMRQDQTEDIMPQSKAVVPPERISLEKYAYRQLNGTEQAVYDEMLSAILSQEERVQLSTTDTEVMQRAYKAVCSDYGGLFWVEGYVFTSYTKGEELVSLEFSPKYTMTKRERRQLQRQIDGIVDAWLAGISISDTDYDKAKYVYELLALNTEYVENARDSQNIVSVFLGQQTVCQGYACAVQYLLEQLGIQSVIVSGTARGEPHAWNLICLDGEYYYMDATWGNNGYRNKEGQETSFIDYNYMAMTTLEMQVGHQPDLEIDLPECTAVLNNYYIKEGNYIEEWDADVIGAKLSQAWESQRVITLRFSDDTLKDQTFQYFIKEGRIVDYCSNITQINYIEDSVWKEISFCFNQE